MEKIKFTDRYTDEEIEVFVLETTTVAGEEYLLVTEEETGDVECWIVKKVVDEAEHAIYEFVEDDAQLDSLAKIFEELLEDTAIE